MVKEDFKNENDLLRHIMTVDKNVEQGRALKKIFTTRENLFITGRAGSGKSTFMRRIVKFLGKCVIVAPTGVAALNAGGQTIHSFFSIKNDPYIPSIERGMLSNKVDVSPFMKKKIKNLDTIVIDEISMVFFFQAEDGIRDQPRSRGSEMCIRDRPGEAAGTVSGCRVSAYRRRRCDPRAGRTVSALRR